MADMKAFQIQTYQSGMWMINSVFDDRFSRFSERNGWMKVADIKELVLSKNRLSSPPQKL